VGTAVLWQMHLASSNSMFSVKKPSKILAVHVIVTEFTAMSARQTDIVKAFTSGKS
jgi:hypothetical protein